MVVRREKMSKLRGNVVAIDEVICGKADMALDYEFRDITGETIPDFLRPGIWRDRAGNGSVYTSMPTGKIPVFLHRKGNPVPVLFEAGKDLLVQHPELVGVWLRIKAQYPEETDFIQIGPGERAQLGHHPSV